MPEPVPLPIAECRLDVPGLREQAARYDAPARRLSITVERPERPPALDALHFALTGRDA